MLAIPLMRADPLSGDARQFSDEADAILDGRGWINTEGPGQATTTYPTQVFFLLGCKAVCGKSTYWVPVVLQHLMVLATAFFVYKLSLLLRFDSIVAQIAGILAAFFPHTIFLANVLISHTTGMFLGVLGLWLLARRPRHPGQWILIGVVWGMAALARFTVQYLVPAWLMIVILAAVWNRRKITRATLARHALMLAGFLVVMAPWYLRVHKYEGGSSGYTDVWRICYSFNRDESLRGNDPDEIIRRLEGDTTLTRSQREGQYRHYAFQNLKSHPQWFINNALKNISYMLINVSTDGQEHSAIYVGIYLSILIGFGLIGLISMGRDQHWIQMPVYLLAIIIFAIHVPIYGYLANAFPAWMGMLPVASQGLVTAIRGASDSRRQRAAPGRWPYGCEI
jgi:4-amino-4-deoxy-L-arabinose transferase-like glycosyltransferase